MPKNKFEGSVDEILENLKQQQPHPASDNEVDKILADLGFEGDPLLPRTPAPQPVQAPSAAKPAEAPAVSAPAQQPAPEPRKAPRAPAPVQEKTAPVSSEVDQLRGRFDEAASDEVLHAPSRQVSENLHVNELVDEEFTKFFSETVAVVPSDEELMSHRTSLFDRFIRRHKAEQYPDAAGDHSIMMPGLSEPEAGATGEILLDTDTAEKAVQREEPQEDEETRPIDLEMSQPQEQEEEEPPRRGLRGLRLFGRKEEPEDTEATAEIGDGPFAAEADEAEIEDYDAPEDAPAVQADLAGKRAGWGLRAVLSAVLSAVLFYLGLTATGLLPAVGALSPELAPAAYLGVNLILLLVCMALAFDVLRDGIPGVKGTPSSQTLPAFAALGAVLQLVVLLAKNQQYDPEKTTLFAAPAALLLCLALAGKAMMGSIVEKNFEMVSRGIDHAAAYRLQSRELTEKVAAGLGEPEPSLLVSRPTGLVRGFLRQSFSQAPSDWLAQKLSWALLAASVLAGGISLVKGHDPMAAASVLAGTLVLGSPLCSTLLAAVPCLMMQKSAARVGAVVPGWSAVEELESTNMVMVGARDLFPQRCVLLHGIKTFEKERIDLAILYAASILIEGCDTLRDVFMNIIQGDTSMLYTVENLNCEVGCGFTAWIDNNRVIIGGRKMMQKHDIELPSLDYEQRYTRGARQPIYLAVSGKLFGMFVVSYRPDPDAAQVLQDLHHGGVSVLVKSDDFSLTDELVAKTYHMPRGTVKVLSAQDRRDLTPGTTYMPQSEGCMTHIGSFASMVGGLQAASGAASGERSASLVQAVGVGFSCALALLLAFTDGMASLALLAVVLYQAAWSALALAMPLLKKY